MRLQYRDRTFLHSFFMLFIFIAIYWIEIGDGRVKKLKIGDSKLVEVEVLRNKGNLICVCTQTHSIFMSQIDIKNSTEFPIRHTRKNIHGNWITCGTAASAMYRKSGWTWNSTYIFFPLILFIHISIKNFEYPTTSIQLCLQWSFLVQTFVWIFVIFKCCYFDDSRLVTTDINIFPSKRQHFRALRNHKKVPKQEVHKSQLSALPTSTQSSSVNSLISYFCSRS